MEINHQNIKQILSAATPEQKIIWNDVFLTFGENIGISQFHWRGQFQGMGMTPLETANANIYYLCYSLVLINELNLQNTTSSVTFSDRFGAFLFGDIVSTVYYDPVVTPPRNRYNAKTVKYENLYFWYIEPVRINAGIFTGFRITI